jgi:hypothetical protein
LGATVTLTGVGTVELSASQAASGHYAATTATFSFQVVADFSISAPGSTTDTTQTASPGGAATFTLNLAPANGTSFPTLTTLALSGMPSGATAAVTPSTWAATSGSSWSLPANTTLAAITLTIQLPAVTAHVDRKGLPSLPYALLGILLLPFAGKMRRVGKRLGRTMAILLLLTAGVVSMAGINGCTNSGASSILSAQQKQTYTMVETVTSGALSHSTTITLTVE